MGSPLFAEYYVKKFGEGNENVVVVSPDVGSVSRARTFALKMGLGLAIIDKRREKANQSEVMNIIGNVKDKTVILYDDMVDTAGSLCGAANALVTVGGASEIYACATHGVLSGLAIENINKERHQGACVYGYDSLSGDDAVDEDQVSLRGAALRRGHRARLRGSVHLDAVQVTRAMFFRSTGPVSRIVVFLGKSGREIRRDAP